MFALYIYVYTFIYLGIYIFRFAPMLGADIFIITMLLLDRSLYHYRMTLLSLGVVFILKSFFSDLSIANLAFFPAPPPAISICAEYLSPSLCFQSVFVFTSEGNLL